MRDKVKDYRDREAGFNVSWGAVFAGVVTFIALVLTFSLINAALGLGQFDPTSPNPFSGVGTGQAIWSAIALILSFLGAGFVSGMAARRLGYIHGFLTWATSLIIVVIMVVWITSALLSAAGSVISTTAGVATDAVTSVADTAGNAVSSGMSAIADNIDMESEEIQQLDDNVANILEDTDIPELQPEYLRDQLSGATNDIAAAAQDLVVNPESSDQIFSDLQSSLSDRAENIPENVDEEAVSNAIEENTDLTGGEADEATQNIVQAYNNAATSSREMLNNAGSSLQDTANNLQSSIDQLTTEARQTAESATETGSTGSIWAFVGVVVGAILSSIGGTLGVNFVREKVDEQEA